MRNILKNRAWHLFLAIAFISMQSASAHIHLASSHDHDGHDHSHSPVVHAHNVASHHVEVFESDYQTHSSQVVELCQGWVVKYGKCLSDLAPQAALVSNVHVDQQSTVTKIYFDNHVDYNRCHFCSKVQARAPPALSPLTFKL